MLDRIGRYEIKSELGKGGMAVVYRALDPSFDRQVAIKLLPSERELDADYRQRFEREAKTLAGLEHSAIVPVYDYAEQDGRPYIVMRLMNGGSLTERLESGALSIAEIRQILTRIGGALDRAHVQGIVHRDVKPANILFDDDGEPYLSDFGIVKIAESGTLTKTGDIVGTPAYMSPEQVMGEKDLDGRTDIYSLGAILFQMLSGRLPYEADSTMGMAMAHINLPEPQLQEVDPNIPIAYQGIINRAMAKDPARRFQSGSQMARGFDAATRGMTSDGDIKSTVLEPAFYPDPVPQSGGQPPPAPEARNRLPIWGGLAALLLFLIVGGYIVFNILPAGNDAGGDPGSAPEAPVVAAVPSNTAVSENDSETATELPTPTADSAAEVAATVEAIVAATETAVSVAAADEAQAAVATAAAVEFATTTRIEDENKLYLGDQLLLDIDLDAPGCFGINDISHSPTGEHFLVLVGCFEGDNHAFIFRSDGSDRRQLTAEGDYVNYDLFDWSPDGQSLVYQRVFSCCLTPPAGVPPDDIVKYDVSTGAKVDLLTGPGKPAWSPDGRWISVLGFVDRDMAVDIVSSGGGDARRLDTVAGISPFAAVQRWEQIEPSDDQILHVTLPDEELAYVVSSLPGALPPGEPIPDTQEPTYRVINVDSDDSLNVRAGPGVDNEIVGEIPYNGTGVTMGAERVQVDDANWAPVGFGGFSGWANIRYLELESDP